MIDRIEGNPAENVLQRLSSGQTRDGRRASKNEQDASLEVNYAGFIEEAGGAIPQEDGEAVRRAKELLVSGELESAEKIRAAAENLARFGI